MGTCLTIARSIYVPTGGVMHLAVLSKNKCFHIEIEKKVLSID